MSPFIQQLVAYAVVFLAASWLAWRWLRAPRSPACERCGPSSAPSHTTATAPGKGLRPRSLRVIR